jgi:beta-glucosidase
MPGPGRAYGPALAAAVTSGRLPEATLDELVERQLSVFAALGALDGPTEPPAVDTPQDRALLRQAASSSMVLLRNDGMLPLSLDTLPSVAVIGPNAGRGQIAGGGSAQVRPRSRTSPVDALRARADANTHVHYERGCDIDTSPPLLDGARVRTSDGGRGFAIDWFAGPEPVGAPVARTRIAESLIGFTDPPVPGLSGAAWSLRATSRFTPLESGPHTWTLSQAGIARLFVNETLLIDGAIEPPPPPGIHFFGMGSIDLTATAELTAGREYRVTIELMTPADALIGGVRVGCRPMAEADIMERAVAAAAKTDAAIVVAGTSDEWESEGRDREFLGLPGPQDELIRRVAAVNPKTVVVVNAGAPVSMPWAQDVSAVVQCWFGGQEMSDALVDVLTGESDPGGRLPTTFPLRIEDTPAFGSSQPEGHIVRYAEGIFVGYRWYDARRMPTLFPFGHGLSYGDITVGTPTLSAASFRAGQTLVVDVPVDNVGARPGTAVIQGYVVALDAPVARPPQELKAFAKLALGPGERMRVQLMFDDRSFSYWHGGDAHSITGEPVNELSALPGMAAGVGQPSGKPAGWLMAPGTYDVVIATSAAKEWHRVRVHVVD